MVAAKISEFSQLLSGRLEYLLDFPDSSISYRNLNDVLHRNGLPPDVNITGAVLRRILEGDLFITREAAVGFGVYLRMLPATNGKYDPGAANGLARNGKTPDIIDIYDKAKGTYTELKTPLFPNSTQAPKTSENGKERKTEEVTHAVEERSSEDEPKKTAEWRKRNPKECHDKKSFQEMLEECFYARMNFHGFIRRLARDEWNISTTRFYTAFNENITAGNHEKSKGISRATAITLIVRGQPPGLAVCEGFVLAYDLAPKHQMMLYKMARGHPIAFKDVKVKAEAVVNEQNDGDKRKKANDLLDELIAATGMSEKRIEAMMGFGHASIYSWKKVHIGSLNTAKQFVDVLLKHIELPEHDRVREVSKLRKMLLELLTGRELQKDLDEILIDALSAENPARNIIEYAIDHGKGGRDGYKHILKATGMTLDAYKYVLAGKRQLKESEAMGLAGYLNCTGKTIEDVVLVTTGFPDPKTLLDMAVRGKITAKQVLEFTLLRRGDARGKVSGTSAGFLDRFIEDRDFWPDSFKSTKNLVAYMGYTNEDARKFRVLAKGERLIDLNHLMDEVEAGRISNKAAMTIILVQTGLDQKDMRARYGCSKPVIAHIEKVGFISGYPMMENQLATDAGMNPATAKRFNELFCRSDPRAIIKQVELGLIDRGEAIRTLFRMTGKDDINRRLGINAMDFHTNTTLFASKTFAPSLPTLAKILGIEDCTERLQLIYHPEFQGRPGSYEDRRKRAISEVSGAAIGPGDDITRWIDKLSHSGSHRE